MLTTPRLKKIKERLVSRMIELGKERNAILHLDVGGVKYFFDKIIALSEADDKEKTMELPVWNDAKTSVPKENGEYLCKLALLKHCDCTEVDAEPIVYSYAYDVIYYDKNNGFNDYDDTEIIVWMPIPECDIE